MFLLPSQIHLFKDLDDPRLQKLLDDLPLRKFPKGFVIFEEGEEGNELYAVLSGTVEVVRRSPDRTLAPVAQLRPGDIFGEFSYLTGETRSTSAVALEDVSLLEVGFSWLKITAEPFPTIEERLNALYRSRILANILKGTKVFASLSASQIDHLVARMILRRVKTGEIVFQEGTQGQDLCVLKKGEVEISKAAEGRVIKIAVLRAGDVLGEMALLTGEPRTATARALTECEIMLMPEDAFRWVLEKAPRILKVVEDIVRSRADQTRRALEEVVNEVVSDRWEEQDEEEPLGIQVMSLDLSVTFESGGRKTEGKLFSVSSQWWMLDVGLDVPLPAIGTQLTLQLVNVSRIKECKDLFREPLVGIVLRSDETKTMVSFPPESPARVRATAILTALARARVRLFIFPSYDTAQLGLTLSARFPGGGEVTGALLSMSQTTARLKIEGTWEPGAVASIRIRKSEDTLATCEALCLGVDEGVSEIQFEYDSGGQKSMLENAVRTISQQLGYGRVLAPPTHAIPESRPAKAPTPALTLTKHFRSPQKFVKTYLSSIESGILRVESKDPLSTGTPVKIYLTVSDRKGLRRIACAGVVESWKYGTSRVRLDDRSGELARRLQQICRGLMESHSADTWENRKKQLGEMGLRIGEAPNWAVISFAAVAFAVAVYTVASRFMRTPTTPPAAMGQKSQGSEISAVPKVRSERVPSRRVGTVLRRSSTLEEKRNVVEEPLTPEFLREQKALLQEGLKRQIETARMGLPIETDPKRIAEIQGRIRSAEQAIRNLDTVDPNKSDTWNLDKRYRREK